MRALGRFTFVAALGLDLGACGGIVVYPDEETDETDTGVETSSIETTTEETGGEDGYPSDEDQGVDCSGAFGQPEVLFEDVSWYPQALSLTKDELEFFYARGPITGGERHVVVRRRSSSEEPFGEPEPVLETETLCDSISPGSQIAALDVSGDGLRLYVGCNTFPKDSYPNGPLLVAVRADRTSPFLVVPQPVGAIGISIGISRDELSAFATSRDPSISNVLMYQRNSVFEAFGEAMNVPGSPLLQNPEPVPGGLQLMGVDTTSTSHPHLAIVERPSLTGEFGGLSYAGLPVPAGSDEDRSPAIGADCRTLYFTRRSWFPSVARVMVARR